MFRTTKMFAAGPLGLSIREVPFEHLLTDPIVRLVVRSEQHVDEGFGAIVEKLGYQSVIYGIDEVAWMDVGPKGVNKATMLAQPVRASRHRSGEDTGHRRLVERHGDAGLGRTRRRHGYRARLPVKACADTVTSGVPGDGVADVLDALFR